ncbi:hypothetical protein LBMAG27_18320 [Bacteroidota bacterium]|nr:hypothetical protein LBMAG27_18320 [Bacteroidota bacterium]
MKKSILIICTIILSQFNFAKAQVTTDSLYILPNPICQDLTIHYNLVSNDTVSLNIFDVTGRIVHLFFSKKLQGAAFYTIQFNADSLQPGVYIINLDYGFNHTIARKIVKECDANFQDTITVAEKLAVYPNPVESEIIIETAGTALQQIVITDISGRVLQKINSETQNEIINMNVSWLHPGIYFIPIFLADGKEKVMKFVKK